MSLLKPAVRYANVLAVQVGSALDAHVHGSLLVFRPTRARQDRPTPVYTKRGEFCTPLGGESTSAFLAPSMDSCARPVACRLSGEFRPARRRVFSCAESESREG